MGRYGTRRGARTWTWGALQAAAIVAVAVGCSASSANAADAPARAARAGLAQNTGEDPCRHITAQELGKAFGRILTSSKRVNACEYRDSKGGIVIVKVDTGREGAILAHVKRARAEGHKGADKVAAPAGEAYFESILPAFVGRVGNHNVQIETTIEPVPREAMIAVGRQLLEALARK